MSTTRELQVERTPIAGWLERWAPFAGIFFVVMMVVGSMLVNDIPLPDAPRHEVVSYLSDSSAHTRNIIGAYLWVVGSLAFLWFLMRLWGDLRAAQGRRGGLANLAFGAGVAFAAVWTVSAAAFAAVPYAIEWRDAPVSSTDLVRVLPPMGRLLLLQGGGFAGLLVVLATSILILRTRVYPRWLGYLGLVAVVLLPFDALYLNIFPFWGWVFVASVVLIARRKHAVMAPDAVAVLSASNA